MSKIIHLNNSADLLRYLYQAAINPDYNIYKVLGINPLDDYCKLADDLFILEIFKRNIVFENDSIIIKIPKQVIINDTECDNYNYDKIEEWLEEHKKDRIRNAIKNNKYDLRTIVELLPCKKCKWRYSICCPKCNWNREGKYKVY